MSFLKFCNSWHKQLSPTLTFSGFLSSLKYNRDSNKCPFLSFLMLFCMISWGGSGDLRSSHRPQTRPRAFQSHCKSCFLACLIFQIISRRNTCGNNMFMIIIIHTNSVLFWEKLCVFAMLDMEACCSLIDIDLSLTPSWFLVKPKCIYCAKKVQNVLFKMLFNV